jgi:hypothetical protein
MSKVLCTYLQFLYRFIFIFDRFHIYSIDQVHTYRFAQAAVNPTFSS